MLDEFQKKGERNPNLTQGLTVVKTSTALNHGPSEVGSSMLLSFLVAGEYLPLSAMAVAPPGLSDAAQLVIGLNMETEPRLKELGNLQR